MKAEAQPAAVVLAAGLSQRMGKPKMVLPWGQTTIIRHVVETLMVASIVEVVVVTGGARELVEAALEGTGARCVFNPDYANGEMARSAQVGVRALSAAAPAFLLALGDQPQMQASTVRQVLDEYERTSAPLILPSYQMRRGHPWLIGRALWPALLGLSPSETLRDFINRHNHLVHYLNVDTPTILADLDTPEDYQRSKPGA